MNTSAPAKRSFKEQMLLAREEAIIATVNRLLAEKGFDAMTVDEVAADVGIAKASLYKHFPSKEALAAAAMVRVIQRAQAHLHTISTQARPIERLQAMVRWTLQTQLAGQMPSLPSQNSTLRAALVGDRRYMDALMEVSDTLGEWIVAAQADGSLDPKLPPIAVLYTLYARACDPVVEFLKLDAQRSDAEIIDIVLGTCFGGLAAR